MSALTWMLAPGVAAASVAVEGLGQETRELLSEEEPHPEEEAEQQRDEETEPHPDEETEPQPEQQRDEQTEPQPEQQRDKETEPQREAEAGPRSEALDVSDVERAAPVARGEPGPAAPAFDPWAASIERRQSGVSVRDTTPSPVPTESAAPGGYWALGEAPRVAPPDGEEELYVAKIVLPIGLLTVASAAPLLYLTQPGDCVERSAKWGYSLDPDECRSLFILSSIRVAYGIAGALSGVALLAVGLHRRKRYRHWRHHHVRWGGAGIMAHIGGGAGVRVRLHF